MKSISLAILLGLSAVSAIIFIWRYEPELNYDDVAKAYAIPESKFTTVEGQRVHYTDQGQGPAIILLHGFAQSLHAWQDWQYELTKHARVLIPTLPGFGLSGPNPRGVYTPEAYAAFVAAFLDKMAVAKAHVIGHSMGGLIAWHFAATHQERIDRLVLMAPAGLPGGSRAFLRSFLALPGLGEFLLSINSRVEMAYFLRESFDPNMQCPLSRMSKPTTI